MDSQLDMCVTVCVCDTSCLCSNIWTHPLVPSEQSYLDTYTCGITKLTDLSLRY